MPEQPVLGAMVGVFLAVVAAISAWTAVAPSRTLLLRLSVGLGGVLTVGLVFRSAGSVDYEWAFLLGAVWLVMTTGLMLLQACFKLVEGQTAHDLASTRYSLRDLFMMATVVVGLGAVVQLFSQPDYKVFFFLFSLAVALTCLVVTSLTLWACLARAHSAIRTVLWGVGMLLVAGAVYQAAEAVMAMTQLSPPGVGGAVWLTALGSYTFMNSVVIGAARLLGFRMVARRRCPSEAVGVAAQP